MSRSRASSLASMGEFRDINIESRHVKCGPRMRNAVFGSALAVFFVVPCLADDALSASQLKTLFGGGKTFEATNEERGISFTNYFSPDGRVAMITERGGKRKGTWRVDESGTHCVKWEDQSEICHKVVRQGDGTYKRFLGDKHVVTIHKVTDGNPNNIEP